MRLLDLCAGIGGFSLAASWLGVEVAGQVEIDPWCRRVLAKHWPNTIRMADVFDVKGNEFGTIDIITAGFPCQPYSVAGKRRGSEDDRAIWPQIARITCAVRPTYCLFENVPGIIGFSEMGLDGVLADLEAIGYTAGAVVIPAGAVNALHRRDRVWIMAYRNGDGSTDGGKRSAVTCKGGERRAHRGGSDGDTWQVTDGSAGEDTGSMADAGHTESSGRILPSQGQQPGQRWEARREPAPRGCVIADTERERLEGQQQAGATVGDRGGAQTPRTVDAGPDGLSPELVRSRWADGSWELDLPRVVTNEPERRQKLQAAGNAIVPQVAYEILRVMIGEAT